MRLSSSILVIIVVCLSFGRATIFVEGNTSVHIVYLGDRRHNDPVKVTESHHSLLASVVGSKVNALELIVYSYRHGFSGFAAKLTQKQAQDLAELPGVVKVIPNSIHKLETTRTWDSLGLSSRSHSNLLHKSARGDNVIVAVFDTGIWPESKSFAGSGLGPIPSRWKGVCESGERFNATQHCHSKIIGARWFADGFTAENHNQLPNANGETEYMSARDANGHGTHTASTVAGALVPNVTYIGLAGGTVRGGAPNARLAIYKVCWTAFGMCSSADILMAFDMAIHDGVDVISVSLGSSVPMYSNVDDRDGIAVGSFHAVANGITVVAAAGNSGPSDQTVTNVAPWILTVAANAVDRLFPSSITLGSNKSFMGQALYTGKEIGFTGLFYPEPRGELDAFTPGDCDFLTLNNTNTAGKVVLCFATSVQMPVIGNAAFHVNEAGGIGLIVAKHQSGALSPCGNDFPCVSVDFEIGTEILHYIRSTSDPLVKLSPSTTFVGKPLPQNVAYFSSRGPNSIAPAILKPDISAPGVNILAATSAHDGLADNGYAMFSGTSMATPHISGIVALLKALHPSWSPAAIRSALVTTASRSGPSGEPIYAEGSSLKLADPFDFGGGIVNPNCAADPGLIYDMGKSDYVNYLCAMHYNDSAISHLTGNATACLTRTPSILDLNLPSITIPNLGKSSVTVRRTVTNVGPKNSFYRARIEAPPGVSVSIKPEVMVFNALVKKCSFKVTFSTKYQLDIGYVFGSLTWTTRGYAVRIPLSVKTALFHPFTSNK